MYATLPAPEIIQKTIESVRARGIATLFTATKEEALQQVKNLIPEGSDVMTGSSTTLEQIGFVELLKSGNHPWKNLKTAIISEKDPDKQSLLRKQSVLSQYFLGSVHAIAETGEILAASASGSQLPSYAYTSKNVIWIAGAQKIVPTLEEGLKRIREHSFPLEDARMKKLGHAAGSFIGKILIIERESARKLTLILVHELLGF